MLLLVHEMIHAVHFGGRPGSLPVPTGVVGAALPWPPPAWLLEGVAVWAESRLVPGPGGRLDDPDARAVLRELAAAGRWPALDDAALISHAAWPGGRLRYLAGGALVRRLVDRHGLETLRRALRRFETQPPWRGFAHAWRSETGADLAAEWRALGADLEAEARALPDRTGASLGAGRTPALAPDGRRLAWRDGATVRVAPLPVDGPAPAAAVATLASRPDRLTWTADGRLLYARLQAVPEGRRREVFLLDPTDGRERRLTRGAHARAPAPEPNGCVVFVRDRAPGGGALRRWCPGGPEDGWTVWRPPDGARLAGLATSPSGRIALVLDRHSRRALVELVGGAGGVRPVRLPGPTAGLRDPVWEGDDALWVVAEVDEARTASWRIDLVDGRAAPVTAPRGGIVDHAPWIAAARRAGGPVLVRPPGDAPWPPGPAGGGGGQAAAAPPTGPVAGAPPGLAEGALRRADAVPPLPRYDPRAELRLLGWLPVAGDGGVGVRALAVDPARRLGIEATAGASPGPGGPLGPAWLGLGVRVGGAGPVATPAPPAPATASLRLGVLPVRPHRAAALGPRPRLDVTAEALVAAEPRVRLGGSASLQLLEGRPRLGARLRLASAAGRADAWGVPVGAWAVAATWRSDPLPEGRSSGAWLDGALWRPLGGAPAATLRLDARGGWRPPPAAPVDAWRDAPLTARAEVGWTVPVRARLADGRWALERLRWAPAVRLGARRAAAGRWGVAAGLEGRVAADLVLGYGATSTLALEGGLAWSDPAPPQGWLRLQLPGLP
jgi:hypothetical protein